MGSVGNCTEHGLCRGGALIQGPRWRRGSGRIINITRDVMSSTEHIHSAWGLGACVLAAHVEAICPGECHLLPQSRGLGGRGQCAQLLRCLGLQPQRRADRRFDLEASRMSGQRRSEGRVGLHIAELAHPPSWAVGSQSCDATAAGRRLDESLLVTFLY